MKATRNFAAIVLLLALQLDAAELTGLEQVQFKDKRVSVWPGGQILEAPNEAVLPFNIVVQTNGTFKVKGGKERQLLEGEILGRDGMLLKPDGSIMPIMDSVSMNRGRVMVFKDGESTQLRAAMQLGDGTTILPEGKIITRDGSSRRLLDGELFQLEGGVVPARDTITMQNGRVMVQKDGAMLAVEPGRSLIMNDGTKVLGDGTVIHFNGEQSKLTEGEILIIEGVVRKK